MAKQETPHLKTLSQTEREALFNRLCDEIGEQPFYDNIDHLDGVSQAYDIAEFLRSVFFREHDGGLVMSGSESRGLALVLEELQNKMLIGYPDGLTVGGEATALTRPDPLSQRDHLA